MAKKEHLSNPGDETNPHPDEEVLRRTVVGVRELDFHSSYEISRYFILLTDPRNREHFAGVPENENELALQLGRPEMHGLVGVNALDENVGFAIIRDASPDEHDSWIRMFVVENRLQRRRLKGEGELPGVGMQFLDKVVKWGFSTKTHDGRDRESIHAAVVMDVPGWDRSRGLFRGYGFRSVYVLDDEVDVFLRKAGATVKRDIIRLALSRRDWEGILVRRETTPPPISPTS